MNPRIVGQIVRHGLIPVPQVAAAVRGNHHFHRRQMTALRGPVLGCDWQGVLDFRHVSLVKPQLLAFFLVPDQDSSSVRGLYAQHIVQVSFIRRHDHVKLRILEVQPGDVALVVIIAQQRRGAKAKKIGERLVLTKLCSFAQRLRGRLQQVLVSLVVGNTNKFVASLRLPMNRSIRIVNLSFLLRVLFHIGFDL